MKLNKKLLMAALAGAIVVGGGVGSFAEDAANADIPKTPEYKGESGMYKPNPNDKLVGEKFHKDLQEAKDKAIQEAKANGITSELLLKNIKNAKTIESVKSFAEELINSHASSNNKKRLEGEDLKKAIDKVKAEEADKKEPGDDIPEDSPYYRQTPFAYRTKEEAEQAAKKALENELLNPGHINNGYEVAQKSDGNWDYVLKIVDKSEEQTPEKPSNPDVKPNPSTPGRQPSTPEGPYAPYAPSTSDEGKTPGKEEKPGEDKKPEDKKTGEDKKPEDKKPGEDKKPEDKKTGKENKKKENTDSPNKKNKKKLPKAGSEAEILTLAAASLSSVAGAFISLKKRK